MRYSGVTEYYTSVGAFPLCTHIYFSYGSMRLCSVFIAVLYCSLLCLAPFIAVLNTVLVKLNIGRISHSKRAVRLHSNC